jgi:bifunctional NMN adenylyltransferase/nudix hydrolase
MNEKATKADVGVLVGRFQVHQLTCAHKELIQYVLDNHTKVIIFLGLARRLGNKHDPLDFESRKQMLLKDYPTVNVLYIKDMHDDQLWSQKLDEMIGDLVNPTQSVVLYGGRDSFISHYKGKNRTQELESSNYVSGTNLRQVVSKTAKSSDDWRAGAIWQAYNQYDRVDTCVDVIIYDEHTDKVLLARKPDHTLYQFIGGFADPRSESFEIDARREALEETGVEVGLPEYIGSCIVDDWRYRRGKDRIKTMIFVARYVSGHPEPNDDVEELKWVDAQELNNVEAYHKPLVEKFQKWYANKE